MVPIPRMEPRSQSSKTGNGQLVVAPCRHESQFGPKPCIIIENMWYKPINLQDATHWVHT